MIEVNNKNRIKSNVEEKANEAIKLQGAPESQKATWKVIVTFFQRKDRWLKNDPSVPRQDWGIDLDNLLKDVFDGLGPIIGYRKDFTGAREHSGVWDSNIVEVYAKKVNNSSDKDMLGIEVELLHIAKAEE